MIAVCGDFAKGFHLFDASKMIQDTAFWRSGVKLKPRPRNGTTWHHGQVGTPSTPHVLRGGIQVIGSNYVVWRFKIANCWVKRNLKNQCLGTNHRLKCLMEPAKFESLELCKMCQDIFLSRSA